MIFIVRTTVGREKTAMDSIEIKVKNENNPIKVVLSPAEIKGYVFVEGATEEEVRESLKNIPHVRGIIGKEVPNKELDKFMEEKSEQITLKEGDLVEVVGGPFKREKAKIVRLNEQKREAKIELIEAVVPIPITIKLDLLKKITESK